MYNKIWFDWKVGNMKKLIQNSSHAQEDALMESTMYFFLLCVDPNQNDLLTENSTKGTIRNFITF